MINRRSFIRHVTTGALAAGLGHFPVRVTGTEPMARVTILHTNDVHSHIDPFPDDDPNFPGLGGAARRAAIIDRIRKAEPNVLLFDSGDFFQGTPYFDRFGGEVELKTMSAMGYDAATLGDHDFDLGIGNLSNQLVHAEFPIICSNYDFRDTPLEGRTVPWKVFTPGGMRIGVFGLGVELEGLVNPARTGKIRYLDPLPTAAETAYHLKRKLHCDLVVCLSHLGFSYRSDKISDVVLARESMHIDLILGGHTHTFIDEPYRYFNRVGQPVLVAQAGWAGIRLGRIDYYIAGRGGRKIPESSTVKISKKSREK